ncbi:MAG TPA: hypothetical protein VJN70_18905, partial [Gemmatimonadaceae bacterium]|nr:hypothetical protein [Gemmatimonadaceae bacterium]
MRSSILTRPMTSVTLVVLALATASACGKKQESTAQTSGGAIAPGPTALKVVDITLGRSVSADRRIADQADTFSPRDTIYASVHTTGTTQNANLAARWTYQDGQVVTENNEAISPTGDAYTEFHIFKPSGWPAGKYTMHLLVNGQEVQTKELT